MQYNVTVQQVFDEILLFNTLLGVVKLLQLQHGKSPFDTGSFDCQQKEMMQKCVSKVDWLKTQTPLVDVTVVPFYDRLKGRKYLYHAWLYSSSDKLWAFNQPVMTQTLSTHVHLNTQFFFFFYPPSLAQDETKTSDLSSSYTLTLTESRAGYLWENIPIFVDF